MSVDERRMPRGPFRRCLPAAMVAWSLVHAAAGCAGSLPSLADDAVVLAFGDSLTAGIGGSGENYPARLGALVHRSVINAGVPGDTTADGRRRVESALREPHLALAIICLGVNDRLQGRTTDAMRADLQAMLDAAESAGVPVLLIATPQLPVRQAQADPVFARLALGAHAVLDDVSLVKVLGAVALKADLVHPNAEGYRELARRIADRLRAEGAL